MNTDPNTATPQPKAAHTPGPWRVQPGYLNIYALSDGDVGLTCCIATVHRHQSGDQQAETNARLIAAAPDLLMVARIFALAPTEPPPGILQSAWERAISRAREAIAKAEGR